MPERMIGAMPCVAIHPPIMESSHGTEAPFSTFRMPGPSS